MSVRDMFGAQLRQLAIAKVTLSSATTTSFDFGTPDDINLASTTAGQPGALYHPGDRILAVFSSTASNATDAVSFVVQDAADSSGSIGTPATAVTDVALTGGTGDQFAVTAVKIQAGRPWLRFRATSAGATTTHTVRCAVYAVPAVL